MKSWSVVASVVAASLVVGCSGSEVSGENAAGAIEQAPGAAAAPSTGKLAGVKVEPTITLKLNGVDTTLSAIGAGIRSRQPNRAYLDPNDPDLSRTDLIPYFVMTFYASDPSAVVRERIENYNTPAAAESPFLMSLARQKTVVMRVTTVRSIDADLFTLSMIRKFVANGFDDKPAANGQPGVPGRYPEDKKAREDFLTAYRKVGWYAKGDFIDFIVEQDPASGGTKVAQIVDKQGEPARVLYPSEVANADGTRDMYVHGGAHFGRQVLAVFAGANDDTADPGMAQGRDRVISGKLGE